MRNFPIFVRFSAIAICLTSAVLTARAEPKRETVYVWAGSGYPNGVLGYFSGGYKVLATGITRDSALAALADSARAAKSNGAVGTRFTILPTHQIQVDAFLIRFADPSKLDPAHTFVLR